MRIVSLCPSLTELVFDLGAGDLLVGRTRFCVHPAGRVEGVERVGGTKNPKVERIVELAPDLVLMNEEENRIEDAHALRGAGLRVHASMPTAIGEVTTVIRDIGALLEREVVAEELAARIEERAARIGSEASRRPAVRFAYVIWTEPWMVAGRGTYVSGLLTGAGGENVFTGPDRYPATTIDELRERHPDLVLLSTEPFPFREQHAADLAAALGIAATRVRVVDGELLSWHGSRTLAGLAYAKGVLSGGRDRDETPVARGA